MPDFYHVNRRISELYARLQDDLSRDVFRARLQFDISLSASEWLRLAGLSGLLPQDVLEVQREWKSAVERILGQGKKLLLYCTGVRGSLIGKCLLKEGIDISGFCDRNYDKFPNGLLGKTVYPPSFLLEHRDEYYVIITSSENRGEVVRFLKENHFREDHILPYFSDYPEVDRESCPEQYFEFPQLFPRGTAFVDAGCFDGQDSIRFAEWCGHEYTKILAFEPDKISFRRCLDRLAGTDRVEVIQAGLGGHSSMAAFLSYGQTNSCFAETQGNRIVAEEMLGAAAETVRLMALDDLTKDEKIGFIKMDIEGAEWQALHGAQQTILRDKPLLAICVYHVPGDMLAIMDYLAELVPGYRFWLRHYATSASETVLYASIKDMNGQEG